MRDDAVDTKPKLTGAQISGVEPPVKVSGEKPPVKVSLGDEIIPVKEEELNDISSEELHLDDPLAEGLENETANSVGIDEETEDIMSPQLPVEEEASSSNNRSGRSTSAETVDVQPPTITRQSNVEPETLAVSSNPVEQNVTHMETPPVEVIDQQAKNSESENSGSLESPHDPAGNESEMETTDLPVEAGEEKAALNISDRLRQMTDIYPHRHAIVFPVGKDDYGRYRYTQMSFFSA